MEGATGATRAGRHPWPAATAAATAAAVEQEALQPLGRRRLVESHPLRVFLHNAEEEKNELSP